MSSKFMYTQESHAPAKCCRFVTLGLMATSRVSERLHGNGSKETSVYEAKKTPWGKAHLGAPRSHGNGSCHVSAAKWQPGYRLRVVLNPLRG
ncbi:hypothetical protein COCON_G00088350 [Conger conger]|uniref:Uncharacterized protein n=1 Tax=Conger conger TaxID=82655 RepID=A0A9Q1DKI3_CONCO|nr:hypothetical protein COCON_G00088350 [Conger conger]